METSSLALDCRNDFATEVVLAVCFVVVVAAVRIASMPNAKTRMLIHKGELHSTLGDTPPRWTVWQQRIPRSNTTIQRVALFAKQSRFGKLSLQTLRVCQIRLTI